MSLFRLPVQFSAFKRLLSALVLVFGILQINGCATIGQDFPNSRVSDIKIGQTTQQQVREMFGLPWRMGIEDGRNTWTYGRYRYSLFADDETKDLVIRFDNQGVVRSYTFNTSR